MTQAPDRLLVQDPLASRRRLSVAEYYRMAEAGILTPRDRVELIEGEIVTLSPAGSPHAGTVKRLNRLLVRLVGDRATVSVQDPLRLGDESEPEPDVALLLPRADDYTAAHPIAADVLLVIEVADSSLLYDRRVKRPLYARHGIPEYWIVNLEAEVVEVHRQPTAGGYAAETSAGRNEVLGLVALPDLAIPGRDILG